MLVLLIATSFLLNSISQVVSLEASCPQTCKDEININLGDFRFTEESFKVYTRNRLSIINKKVARVCTNLDFSETSESVHDQLRLGRIQHKINKNDPKYEGVKVIVPKDVNECIDWTKKAMLVIFRNGMNLAFEQGRKEANLRLNCASCELYDLTIMQNPSAEMNILLTDDISFEK